MSIVKKPIYHHSLQTSSDSVCTHVWQDASEKKILIQNPGYAQVSDIEALVAWQTYEIHMMVTHVSLDTCARLASLKSAMNGCLHIHQRQLQYFHRLSQLARKANVCEVYKPHAQHIYISEKGFLRGWKQWSYHVQQDRFDVKYDG
jgi:hypothetical protein